MKKNIFLVKRKSLKVKKSKKILFEFKIFILNNTFYQAWGKYLGTVNVFALADEE